MIEPHRTDPWVGDLVAEHRDPFGLGTATPTLSWRTGTGRPGWRQAAYEVEVSGEDGTGERFGPVESDQSVAAAWPAPPLASRDRRTVRVRAHGRDGSATPWSDPLAIEVGLLEPGDWAARFAAPEVEEEATALVRHQFDVPAPVARARLYVTALGL